MHTHRLVAAALAAVLGLAAGAMPAWAQFDALKGQTLRFVISSPAGSSSDRNRPAVRDRARQAGAGCHRSHAESGEAGGGVGVADVQASSGNLITFGMVSNGVLYTQVGGRAAGQYDLSRLQWLGRSAATRRSW